MFSLQEIRSIEQGTQAAMGREFCSVEIVPVEFRQHVLENRAKKLGIKPQEDVEARFAALVKATRYGTEHLTPDQLKHKKMLKKALSL